MSEATSSKHKVYPLFGYPVQQSSAPAFHNAVFAADGNDAEYRLWSTSEITPEVLTFLRSDQCGGAAVTMPLKSRIMEHLDRITPQSEVTGAVNTIVRVRTAGGVELMGTNTDYIGIRTVLHQAISAQPPSFHAALQDGKYAGAVIGGGATTRSAIYALRNLGIHKVYIINRDPAEVEATITWFRDRGLVGEELALIPLQNALHVEQELANGPPVGLVVGAIPATPPSTPAERTVYSTAMHLFTLAVGRCRQASREEPPIPIFLEMAYIPHRTPMLLTAEAMGLQVVGGINVMIEQGLAQQRIWKSGDLSAPASLSIGAEQVGRQTVLVAREATNAR